MCLCSNWYYVEIKLISLDTREVWEYTDKILCKIYVGKQALCYPRKDIIAGLHHPSYFTVVATGVRLSFCVDKHPHLTINIGVSRVSTNSGVRKHLPCLRKIAYNDNGWLRIVPLQWWRHQMETFSALLAICAGNSPVPGEFPVQRPVTRSFDVFLHLRLNKRLTWGEPWA